MKISQKHISIGLAIAYGVAVSIIFITTCNTNNKQNYQNDTSTNAFNFKSDTSSKNEINMKELRIILTVDNLDEVIVFYRDEMGLKTSKEWHEATGNGIILEAGKASLELVDKNHAQTIDAIEVGKTVAGPVRLAFNIDNNIEQVGKKLEKSGAKKIAEVKQAPWSKVQRMQDPSGLQFTLFETSTLFEE
ncbi:VOC family protein [Mariniflexile sp. AS56]|uniref:VOC family protein n=1 Tax=Mariniflexile sp. AS56 TaxID=3063957 RepID=UPI0026F12021|nr:VOC family protein [Mariniflexile sp. AS56]MDO7173718.1 VOC family protein [Mariniflexile sp. AS56]